MNGPVGTWDFAELAGAVERVDDPDAFGVESSFVVFAFFAGMILGVFSGLFVGLGRRAFGHGFIPDPDFPPPEDGSFEPLLRTTAPFGPALALGAISVILFSERLLQGASILI